MKNVQCLATLCLVLVVAACGGGSGFNGEDGDAEQAAEGGAEGGVSLQVWGASSSPAEDAALQAVIDAYNEQSEDTVELVFQPEYATTLQTALAGGQPPDVFYVPMDILPDLADAGALAPVEDQVSDLDDFYPSLLDAMTYEGTLYAPPKDFSTLGLQYNVTVLEEAGVEPPTTWEELRTAAETLTTDDRVGLALAPEYPRWGAFMFQAGGGVTNEDFSAMTADEAPAIEAFTYLAELFDSGFAAAPTSLDAGWPGEAFGQGKAAMTIEGNWMVGAMAADFPDLDWATAPLPEGPAGPGTFAFTVGYGVSPGAANPEASWRLIDYLVSADVMLGYTEQFPVMPSRESIADQWLDANPDLQPFIDGADYARPFQFVPGFQPVLDTLNSGIEGIASGNADVEDVLTRTAEAGDGILGADG